MIRAALFTALALVACAAAGAPLNEEMKELASSRGCSLCHWEPSVKPGDEVLPPAPSWRDIAARYRGRRGAEDRLVAIVMRGSGSSPQARHWAGKTSSAQMPANPVEISEEDARRLVRWILR